GLEMHARLDHGLAAALRREAGLDGGEDLVIGDGEFFDVEAIEVGDVDRRHVSSSTQYVYTLLRWSKKSITRPSHVIARSSCDEAIQFFLGAPGLLRCARN